MDQIKNLTQYLMVEKHFNQIKINALGHFKENLWNHLIKQADTKIRVP